MQIIIQQPYQSPQNAQIISIEQFQKRKEQRRRRVAKRQLKRFPLFEIEFMQDEFPDYNYDAFVEDVTRKTKKGKSFRKAKSQLKVQGRYPLYKKALNDYYSTKDVNYLIEAQKIRNRIFKDYLIQIRVGTGKDTQLVTWGFPSTVNYKVIEDLLKKVKEHGLFLTNQEAEDFKNEHTRYILIG